MSERFMTDDRAALIVFRTTAPRRKLASGIIEAREVIAVSCQGRPAEEDRYCSLVTRFDPRSGRITVALESDDPCVSIVDGEAVLIGGSK